MYTRHSRRIPIALMRWNDDSAVPSSVRPSLEWRWWVTPYTIVMHTIVGCPPGQVCVCDSLPGGDIGSRTWKQIASILATNEKNITVYSSDTVWWEWLWPFCFGFCNISVLQWEPFDSELHPALPPQPPSELPSEQSNNSLSQTKQEEITSSPWLQNLL